MDKKHYIVRPPKAALQRWATDNHISTTGFATAIGCTYAYAWQVLRGQSEVTFELLARILLAYGAPAADPIAASFKPNKVADWPTMIAWTKRQVGK